MNELTSFEQDLKIAYLNYENEDLKETLKGLERLINIIFKNDTQSDPFWKEEASNVFKAVVLNNFYNKKEMSINDLDSLLANQDEMKKNINEFGSNFKDNELIDFITVSNIPDNTLKSAIEIIMINIGKMNIKNTTTGVSSERNRNMKLENDESRIDCFCGHSFNFEWAKIPSTEKTVYLKCPNCGSELKRGNPNYNDVELINKLRMTYNNIFEDWNLLKEKNLDLKDFFEETEKNAIIELYEAKDKATVYGIKLSQFLVNDNLTCNDEIVKLLINYFGGVSIYDRNFGTNDTGLPCEKLSIDNVGLFRSVLVINVMSIIGHITDISLPLCIDLIFEEKVFVEMLGPVLKTFIPKIFDNVNNVKFYYKNDSLSNINK